MSDPTVEAAAEIFSTALSDLRGAVEGMSADELNRRPAGEDTNSIAVLATHSMHSTRAWLSVAVGAEPPARDRPAEFRAVASKDELLSLLDEMGTECVSLLDGATFDPDRTGLAPWRQGPEAEEPVPAAWALIFALVHLREHVAHAQLTRQLLDTS
ncbi:MAG TPA: DinB family protein [Actinomycetota bacterium]|nr:DinB family protein [Actinomycetota bacterium]